MVLRYASLVVLLLLIPPVLAQRAGIPPGFPSDAIVYDEFGVPHIAASSEHDAFFLQGWIHAQDRLFQMDQFRKTATGTLAAFLGPSALTTDQSIRTVFYTPAERAAQFDALPQAVRDLIEAYVDGLNAYITLANSDPATYKPFEYFQAPFNGEPVDPWTADDVVAQMQFFMRRFGEIGGEELERLSEFQSNGAAWFDANRPIDDPTAYTSLQSGPMRPRDVSTRATPDRLRVDPAVAAQVTREREAIDAYLESIGVPRRLGSFAALVSPTASSTGEALLLGAPQMGQPQQTEASPVHESEIQVEGGLHIAGMTVPGIPGVIIGRAGAPGDQRAWTLTTGVTDNTDTFVEATSPDGSTYLFNGQQVPFEAYPELIEVRGQAPVSYTHFRSVHGPVYAQDVPSQQAYTYRYAFWEQELDMLTAFYELWHAESLPDWQAIVRDIPMSFNLFYADTNQDLAYWHVGSYPQRVADPRLPAIGDGSEEWTGFVSFDDHPQAVNPDQPYLVNWNNKPAPGWPQGDNVSWTSSPPGGYARAYDGAQFLDDHLAASSLAGGISFEAVQELNRVVVANPSYPEYPGSYQQVLAYANGSVPRAENLVPPGQSAFVSSTGVPDPHAMDQWPLYLSAFGTGPIEMKSFAFSASTALEPGVPSGELEAPAPNPATGYVDIAFHVTAPTEVRLAVIDALGREVAVLRDGAVASGHQTSPFDATALAPGVYLVRLEVGATVESRPLVIVR